MITSLTPLDGCYANLTENLTDIFSEYGLREVTKNNIGTLFPANSLIRHRVRLEIEWLRFIIKHLKLIKTDPWIGVSKICFFMKNMITKHARIIY
jgi:adenylosuccinate lyase